VSTALVADVYAAGVVVRTAYVGAAAVLFCNCVGATVVYTADVATAVVEVAYVGATFVGHLVGVACPVPGAEIAGYVATTFVGCEAVGASEL
jgi:hypothetical protein